MKAVIAVLALLAIAHYANAASFARADILALDAAETNLTPLADNFVLFETFNSTHVNVTVHISGIITNPNGEHGMHIHQYGDLSSASASGGHWNPFGIDHGCPEEGRSAGDLGNWLATDGVIHEEKLLDLIDLNGVNSVIGRAVVLHAAQDNCNDVPSSGARLAGGVIGITSVSENEASVGQLTAPFFAVCTLFQTTNGVTNNQKGHFAWSQTALGEPVTAIGKLTRLGTYGVHVHQWGDLSKNDGTGTGSHYDPAGTGHHALPDDTDPHHAGDMGNTRVDLQIAGSQWFNETFDYMSISTSHSIIGRGFIVHANPDDGSQPTGNAGPRDAQCVIGIGNSTLTAIPQNLPVVLPPTGNGAALLPTLALLALSVLAILF